MLSLEDILNIAVLFEVQGQMLPLYMRRDFKKCHPEYEVFGDELYPHHHHTLLWRGQLNVQHKKPGALDNLIRVYPKDFRDFFTVFLVEQQILRKRLSNMKTDT